MVTAEGPGAGLRTLQVFESFVTERSSESGQRFGQGTHRDEEYMMSTTTTASTTLPFVCIFFVAMIFHELAMESLTTSYVDFEHLTTSITMFQFSFCIIVPLVFSGKGVLRDFPSSVRELFTYIKLSAIVYGATALSTASLGFAGVSYVTKVVFKSSKLIPTMVVGAIMERAGFKKSSRRSYSPYDYAAAVMLCLGAVGFAYSPGKAGLSEAGDGEGKPARFGEHGIGIALLSARYVRAEPAELQLSTLTSEPTCSQRIACSAMPLCQTSRRT